MSIQIQIRNKAAVNLTPEVVIVCGNSDYVIDFSFDEEWAKETVKTARFVYRKGGRNYYVDVPFTGMSVKAPVLSDIHHVLVGVYAGDLRTTTPAYVQCEKSILCGSGKHKDPEADVYNELIELINSLDDVFCNKSELEEIFKAYLGDNIPKVLPNPYKLTFKGAVEATYDGSGAVEVEIPATLDTQQVRDIVNDVLEEALGGDY